MNVLCPVRIKVTFCTYLNFNSAEEDGEIETMINGISQLIKSLNNKKDKTNSKKSVKGVVGKEDDKLLNSSQTSKRNAVLLNTLDDPFGLYCTHVISQATSKK